MRVFPVLEAVPTHSAVLIDNLTLSSSDRLLRGVYETAAAEAGLAVELSRWHVSSMVAHDLACFAELLESIIGFDEIYTNALNSDRWNKQSSRLQPLDPIVLGLALTREQQWDADSFVNQHPSMKYAGESGVQELGALVYGHPEEKSYLSRLTAPVDETSRPFGGGPGRGFAVGVGAYSVLSELLGVPYRPSPLRSRVLEQLIEREIREWRVQAGAVAIEYLEKAREDVALDYFKHLAERGLSHSQAA